MFEKGDFDRKGNLRSNIEFTWIGEINSRVIKEVSSLRSQDLETDVKQPTASYSLILTDSYGFEMSFWRRGQDLADVSSMLSVVPVGVTVRATGTVVIRKGRTYFNLVSMEYPNQQRILPLIYQQETGSEPEEGENSPF